MGVWVCSYARAILLKLRRDLERVGCEVLYGDIDCIKFRGEQGLSIVEKINKAKPANFELGKLEFEYKAKELKILDLKWYCAIDE
jgi:DNA polymerase elongation subunit (family B)